MKYYTPLLHKGAFALPAYIQVLVDGGDAIAGQMVAPGVRA
jgi:hypothetical protein